MSDSGSDEQARQMSIAATLSSLQWGRSQGQPDRHARRAELRRRRPRRAARVRVGDLRDQRGDGRRGLDGRGCGQRAAELDIARMLFVNMLDRERADFFRTLEQLKKRVRPARRREQIPIGSEHEAAGRHRPGQHEGLQRRTRPSAAAASEIPIPEAQLRSSRQEYREKLMDEVSEVSDALMERYLEGDEISHEEIVGRSRRAPTTARSSRSCAAWRRATSAPRGCSTRSSRTCPRRSSTADCRLARSS